jgi:hypothetical protein
MAISAFKSPPPVTKEASTTQVNYYSAQHKKPMTANIKQNFMKVGTDLNVDQKNLYIRNIQDNCRLTDPIKAVQQRSTKSFDLNSKIVKKAYGTSS